MNVTLDQQTWINLAIALGIVAGSWLVGWILVRVFGRLLLRLVRKSRTEVDDILVDVLTRHVPLWFIAASAPIAVRIVEAPPGLVTWVDRIARALVTLSVTFAVARFVSGLLSRGILHLGSSASTTLTRKLVRASIVVIGVLVTLNGLGLEITPLVTALGIGSLAVGLALQPTLANFFAGLNLSMAQRIRVGDYIRLDSGQEGHVRDIGWRSTQIHDNSNSVVFVPNAKLVDLIVTNTTLVDSEVHVTVSTGVAYDSDLERVERVALEVARAVQTESEGAVRGWEPVFRFTAFGESAITFNVVLRARSHPERGTVIHDFIKRLYARFDREGIDIPFPQRVVHLRNAPVEASAEAAVEAQPAGPR
ncbi:MAG: mechanosensitive ion channel family protein [Candidatus Eiseniibacteriota bacterium]